VGRRGDDGRSFWRRDNAHPAGRSATRLPHMAHGHAWSGARLVSPARARALVWLGVADPAQSMDEARDDDPELALRRTFFAVCPIPVGTEFKARDLVKRAEIDEDLEEWAEHVGGVDSFKIGHWLKQNKGKPVDGFRIVASKAKANAAKYSIEHVKVAQR
jgi:hypothetical protein